MPEDSPRPLPSDGENISQNVVRSAKEGTHWSGKGGVWAGIVKTVTGKNAYESDKVEQASKLLDEKQIAQNTAMPGVIAGSRQENIKGNSILIVSGQRYAHVMQSDRQIVDDTHYELE